jgi:hypothetical protein
MILQMWRNLAPSAHVLSPYRQWIGHMVLSSVLAYAGVIRL